MKVKIKSIMPNSMNCDTALVSFDDMPANAVLTAVILPGLWLRNNNAKVGGYISGGFYDFGPGKSANLTYSPPIDPSVVIGSFDWKLIDSNFKKQDDELFKNFFQEKISNPMNDASIECGRQQESDADRIARVTRSMCK